MLLARALGQQSSHDLLQLLETNGWCPHKAGGTARQDESGRSRQSLRGVCSEREPGLDAGTVLGCWLSAASQAGHKAWGHFPGEQAPPKALLSSSPAVPHLPLLLHGHCQPSFGFQIDSAALISASTPCLCQPSAILLFPRQVITSIRSPGTQQLPWGPALTHNTPPPPTQAVSLGTGDKKDLADSSTCPHASAPSSQTACPTGGCCLSPGRWVARRAPSLSASPILYQDI